MDLMKRFYDPSIGRFMQVDPVTDTQENYSTYQYGWNNPILRSDPNGDCPSCITGLIGGGIGTLVGGGIEIASQLYSTGTVNDWSAVGGAALQGGVTGGAAGLTGGASLLTTVSVSAGANVVGGAINSAVQGNEITTTSVVTDAVVGAAAGVGGKVLDKVLNKAEGVVFSADLSKSSAKTRSGHTNAGNKQLNDAMSADPKFRAQMEKKLGSDVYDKTSTSNKGRRNPTGYEWDHNTNNPNKLDLRSKENHAQKTANDPNRAGGYSKYWKDKQ